MRLILVRHGQTDWNREYRVQGQSDMPLNRTGLAQAEAIAMALKAEPIEAIYSSPLKRAYQTAKAIRQIHPVEIITNEGLKELDVGEVDGLYYPSLKTETPEFFAAWMADPGSVRWPGGETLPELQHRVWNAVQEITSNDHSGSVVITSHFFTLLTLLCRILGLELASFRRLNLGVAGISIVEFSGEKGKLVSFNDTCHLKS